MTAKLPAKIEPIPTVDPKQPERMIGCVPQWLSRSMSAVSNDHRNQTIPGEMALSPSGRAEAERHVAVLERAAAKGPSDRIAAAIMGVLSAFPAQATSADTMLARSIMYREALADLPAWAVERGVSYWNRGEHGDGKENYAFPPSPPQLRRLALLACQPLRTELALIKRLLEAEVLPVAGSKEAESIQRVEDLVANAFRKVGAA